MTNLKQITAILVLSILSTGTTQAKSLMNQFELKSGNPSRCPLTVELIDLGQQVQFHFENAASMNGVGPFTNSVLYFNNINKGWLITEQNQNLIFMTKVQASSQAIEKRSILSIDGKLVRDISIEFSQLRSGNALLTYRIHKLSKGVTAEAYESFSCQYQ